MVISRTIEALNQMLQTPQQNKNTIGFVPTMGALHDGHLALVEKAKKECDKVIVSIFVNPTQFNNSEDLEHYPRQEEKDLKLLKENDCDFVFIPSADEIYPAEHQDIEIELSALQNVMEGKHRPGHFSGVVNVVARLFELVRPNKAYFGRKDFQQVAVVKEMKRQLQLPVEVISTPTQRESNGLAMSSRNTRLSEGEKQEAVHIYEVLKQGRVWAETYPPMATRDKMVELFKKNDLQLEYLEVVHPETLQALDQDWVPGATACIAAYCGEVRLIDNMELVE